MTAALRTSLDGASLVVVDVDGRSPEAVDEILRRLESRWHLASSVRQDVSRAAIGTTEVDADAVVAVTRGAPLGALPTSWTVVDADDGAPGDVARRAEAALVAPNVPGAATGVECAC